MTKTLLVTLITIASAMSFAQMEDYQIDTAERSVSGQDSDTVQDDYFKGANSGEGNEGSPQINIYNANSNANKQNQKAKADAAAEAEQATNVEANSASDASAELAYRTSDIRNSRKSMEVGTEQKMIEKLEWSRIEDEKDRADRLFGNRLDKKRDDYKDDYKKDDYKEEYKEKIVVVEKPVVYPEAAPVYKSEVVAEKYDYDTTSWWGRETYIAPVIGSTNYRDADNVRADMSMGVLIGSRLDSNISLEAGFLYSELEMDDYQVGSIFNPGMKDVSQYGFTTGINYNFNLGRVSPHIGALLGYTYRQYEEKKYNQESTDSNAFDAGLSAGVDFKLTRNFAIGAEYRFMRNISYDRDEASNSNFIAQQNYNPATAGKNVQPLEELNYQMFLVTGKLSF